MSEEIRRVTINGRDFDLDVARNKLLPVVRGGDGPEPTPAPTPAPEPAPAPQPAPAPTPDLAALQAELDRAKASGTTEATTALLKALGFDKIEDAQTFVTAQRDALEAKKDADTKAREALEAREAAAVKREADAADLINRGVIREALRDAGCPTENLDDAFKLVEITGDITADTAKTAAEALKAKPAFASLFTVAAPGGPAPTPGNPKPPRNPGAPDPLAAGKARAEASRKARQGATKQDLLNDFAPQQSPFANSVT